ncbi:MAG: HAD-IA family hydrolase, partial [Nitrospirae bacterium]|nr:HAD-IA family hydrolase [Nitrospirota bacterium]
PYGSTLIPPKITDVLNFLRDNYSCCFLSNFAKTKTKLERITAIEELTKIKVVMSERRKPDKAAFELALRYLDAIPSETLMIGDRLFTDILGANHTGLVSVYVREPLDPTKDPLFMVRVPRLIENALYSLVNFAMQKKH